MTYPDGASGASDDATVSVTVPPPEPAGAWDRPGEAPAPAPAGAHSAPEPARPSPATTGGETTPHRSGRDGSPLGNLAAIREKALAKLYVDLRVPRWGDDGNGPMIFVRCGPGDFAESSERLQQAQKNPKRPKDWAVTEHARTLVKACIGVWAWQSDEPPTLPAPAEGEPGYEDWAVNVRSLREGDPFGSWTRFDPDLADTLRLPENCGAIAVAQSLFFTDLDLTMTYNKLARWSGVEMPGADQDFTGA